MSKRAFRNIVTFLSVLVAVLALVAPQQKGAMLLGSRAESANAALPDSDSTIYTLLSWMESEKKAKIDDMRRRPGEFEPRVFFFLSHVLFAQGHKDEGAFWFYAALLRTRYDVKRSTHPYAQFELIKLIQFFNLPIDEWAFEDPDRVKGLVRRVVKWDRQTPHDYSPSWINGFASITSLMLGKEVEEEPAEMLLPKRQWEQIAEQTREEFVSSFDNAIRENKTVFEIAVAAGKEMGIGRFRERELRRFADPKLRELADAAERGQLDRVDELIAQGVDVNGQDERGRTPLMFILARPDWMLPRSSKGMERLLERGANPNVRATRAVSAPCSAALSPLGGPSIRMLLAHGADPNLASLEHNDTPIFDAVQSRNPENVRLLILAGADVNHQESLFGKTPLMHAAVFNSFDLVYILLESDADFTIQDNDGVALPWYILRSGLSPESQQGIWRQKCVDYLCKKGVDFREELKRHEETYGKSPDDDFVEQFRK